MKKYPAEEASVTGIHEFSPGETELITALLGREPNQLEYRLYAALWQEKISHKNTIYHIRRLPSESPVMLSRPGDDTTGFINLGEGLAACSILSTHHGITADNADCLEMHIRGAKTVLRQLRIRSGKNAMAQPLKSTDIFQTEEKGKSPVTMITDHSYDGDHERTPLVSIHTTGLAQAHHVVTSLAKGNGNPVYLVTFKNDRSQLSSALDEITKTCAATGMRITGEGGIIYAAAVMAARAKQGMVIHAENLHSGDRTCDIAELLLSAQSESLLLVCEKDRKTEIELMFRFWKISCICIGEVADGSDLTITSEGQILAKIPAASLLSGVGAPVIRKESAEPEYHHNAKRFNIDSVPHPGDLRPVVRILLGHPDLRSYYEAGEASPRDAVNHPLSDALRYDIPGSDKALVSSLCCQPRYVHADPKAGTEITVAEAARRIICRGGRPQALTASMNFGNADDPCAYWQYVQSAKGLNNACRKFNLAVTRCEMNFASLPASETGSLPVFPEPVIGLLGVIDNTDGLPDSGFRNKGDVIFLLGESRNDINSSHYLVSFHRVHSSPPPYFNADKEFILQHHILGLLQSRLINSIKSISGGGLFTALVRSGLQRDLGFDITTDSEIREDAFLFGEAQSRVLVSVGPDNESEFIDFMYNSRIQTTLLGHVTKGAIRVDDVSFGTICEMKSMCSEPHTNSL